jgi:SAM-dependent methyltransferase
MSVPPASPASASPSLHEQGIEAFQDGRPTDAFRLLTRGAAEQIDIEQLNDLAVVAHALGFVDDARAILSTILVLDPFHEGARENLDELEAQLAPPPAPPVVAPGITAAPAKTGFDAAAYWENRLAGEFELGDVGFLGLGEAWNQWAYAVRRRIFRRHVRRLRRDWSAARVLDVGSGTGFYVKNWLELGVRDLTASDITNAVVNRLRGEYPGLDVHRIDIGDDISVLEPASYDVISAFDILFHIVDDEAYFRAMANMATLLKPGGTLVCTDKPRPAGREADPHHVMRPLAQMEEAIAAAGMEIVKRKPAFVFMNDPVDRTGPWQTTWWEPLTDRLKADPQRGRTIGPALFPVELAATRILRDSPSTQIFVCRKPA